MNSNDSSIYSTQKRLGCTDPSALNYDPSAMGDDGSCRFAFAGGTDADIRIAGCTDPSALNYNPSATIPNGSCIKKVLGCTDASAINYNSNANIDDGSCISRQIIYGCTDPSSQNYNSAATIDDGSCKTKTRKVGCKNKTAKNYDPNAEIHDGSLCVYGSSSLAAPIAPPLFASAELNAQINVVEKGDLAVQFNVIDPEPVGAIQIEVEPIELNVSSVLLGLINSYVSDAYDTFIDPDRFYKLLLNYGEDTQTVIANYRVNPINNKQLQLKLIAPVPEYIQTNTNVFLGREVAKSFIDEVRILFAPAANKTPYLRPLNTKVNVPGNYKEVASVTLQSLSLTTGSVGVAGKTVSFEDDIFRKWYSYDWNSVELNQDFTDYNNFVTYGSAELRLAAFREKLRQIELNQDKKAQLAQQLTTGSAYTGSNYELAGPICKGTVIQDVTVLSGSNSTLPILMSASRDASVQIENIIRGFDPYEKYLFYSDGTTAYSASADYVVGGVEYFSNGAWPKNSRNQLFSYTSSTAVNWFATQSAIAARFDQNNINSLVYSIPSFIYEDTNSAAFNTFVLTIGHFFDNIKPYIDQMTTNIYDRGIDPDTGMSTDVVWEIAENFGVKLPNPYSIYSLQEYISSTTNRDEIRKISAETWKRLLHSTIFLLKSRGTKTAINSFLRILGIHPQLLSVKESELNTTSSFYVTEEFTTGLEFAGSTNSYIKIPLSSSLREVKTIQLRYATNVPQSVTVANADNKFALNIKTAPSDSRYGRLEIVSSSNVLVSSSYFKMFDNNFVDVMLRKYPTYVDMNVIQNNGEEITYSSSNATTGSALSTLWSSALDFYVGGSGSIKSTLNFDGVVDEIRAWGETVDYDSFVAQTYDPGSFTGNTYTSSINNLFVQLSFNQETNLTLGKIINETPYFNTIGTADPSDFVARTNISFINVNGFVSNSAYTRFDRKVRYNTPTIGGSTYTTTKIKIGDAPVFNAPDLDVNGVPTLKRLNSIVKLPVKAARQGTNIVSLTISPTDFQNQNISRAFGGYNVNNVIGDPGEVSATEYKKLKELQDLYSKYFYSKVDANKLIRMFEAVLDGMSDFISFLMPLKSKLHTGILIEPNLLERIKIPSYRGISVDGSQTRNSVDTANTASIYAGSDYIYALEKTIDISDTSYNIYSTYNVSSSLNNQGYDDFDIKLSTDLLPTFVSGSANKDSVAEDVYKVYSTTVNLDEITNISAPTGVSGSEIALFSSGAIIDAEQGTPTIGVSFNSPSEFAKKSNTERFLLDLFLTGSLITSSTQMTFVSKSENPNSISENSYITYDADATFSDNVMIGGKNFYGEYNVIGKETEKDSVPMLGMNNLNVTTYSSGGGYSVNKNSAGSVIDPQLYNIHKFGVKVTDGNIRYTTDGTGEVYPFAMGIQLGNNAGGSPIDRTNIKYLYEIGPSADFSDIGVTNYFYKQDGLYIFPVIQYIPIRQYTANFLSGSYVASKALSGSFAEWKYGQAYFENDVVVQNISNISDINNPTISTLVILRTDVSAQNDIVTSLRRQLSETNYGKDSSDILTQLRTAEALLESKTNKYNKLRDDLRYASAGNKYFYRFKRKTSITSYVSLTPPAVDRENWELILYNPILKKEQKRILLNTDELNVFTKSFSELTVVSPTISGDIFGRTEFSIRGEIQIAANDTITGTFNLAKIAELMAVKAELSSNYRIRLYRTAAQRDADLSRAFGTEPTNQHGVLFDGIIEDLSYNILSPTVRLLNGDAPVQSAIYYSITNLDSFVKVFKLRLYLYVYEGEKKVPVGYLPRHYKFTRDNSTATKRRNYVGCLQTQDTTTDGLSPVQITLSSGTDITVANVSPNDSIVLGGGGALNVI